MIQQTIIREVKISYRKTKKSFFHIRAPKDAASFIRGVLPDNSREHCIALFLNGYHQVISYACVSTGTANMALLTPREIFQRAVAVGAVSLVLAHNHPSGNSNPSEEDRKATTRIREAADIMAINLLDHIIITDFDFYSFKDHGYL